MPESSLRGRIPKNPTAELDVHFGRYLERRRGKLELHTASGGLADYAFALDHQLRQKLAAAGPIRALAQGMAGLVEPLQKQLELAEGIAVGPRQLPQIHAIGEDCARRLGIGVPQIFLNSMPPGGFTFATDDTAPMIVLSSALVGGMLSDAELAFVIGHECGHIHNLHGVYNTAVELLLLPVAQGLIRQLAGMGGALDVAGALIHFDLIAGAVRGGLKLFLLHWSRAAEITCDRAGLICCGDLGAAESALVKIGTGGMGELPGFDLEEYLRQADRLQASPVRLLQLGDTHPLIPKRIAALRAFAECQVLHSWRPDALPAFSGARKSKAETDTLCEQLIAIVDGGGR